MALNKRLNLQSFYKYCPKKKYFGMQESTKLTGYRIFMEICVRYFLP